MLKGRTCIFKLLVLCAIAFTVGEASCAQPLKVPFALKSELSPIAQNPLSDDIISNDSWDHRARMLRVRDLKVYHCPICLHRKNIVQSQQRSVLQQLKSIGFSVQQTSWEYDDGRKTTGFKAQRRGEVLVGLWETSGSSMSLYWGHQEPETPSQKLNDALIVAVIYNKTAEALKLLEQGASPRALDYNGASVLVLATQWGRTTVVKQLLVKGKNHLQVNDFESALKVAASAMDLATLQVFLDSGLTPRQIGSALRVSASVGAKDAATLLLPHAPRDDMEAALVTASFVEEWRGSTIQYPEIVRLILTRKPSQSALDMALLNVVNVDENNVVAMLLAAGASMNARDVRGQTPLIRAAYNRDATALRALLKAGAEVNARDNNGDTALTIAAPRNWSATINTLLSSGADPMLQNQKGESAISLLQKRIANPKRRDGEREKIVEIVRALNPTAT